MNTGRLTVRDGFGTILGFMETDAQGRKVAKDFSFKILGWYDPSANHTLTFDGRIIAQCDAAIALIFLEAKK